MSDEEPVGSYVTGAVLVGGLGTRLREAVSDRPKILAEVRGRPFVAYLLDQLLALGITRTILATGFGAELVERELGGAYRGMELVYSRETSPLGTGGALRKASELVSTPFLLAMNGDSYLDMPLADFWNWFRRNRHEAALAGTRVDDAARYGTVRAEGDLVTGFEEKSGKEIPGLINAGVYLLRTELLAEQPSGVPLSLERDVFPALAGSRLHVFQGTFPFIDIGTPASYRAAQSFPFSAPAAGAVNRQT